MTYRFFLVLMEIHKADPETVEQFLDDPEFREAVMRRMQAHGKTRELLNAVVEETEKQKES